MNTDLHIVPIDKGVRTLGSDGAAPKIETDRAWLTATKTAYMVRRDTEQLHRKTLTLVLVNKLNELLGMNLRGYNPNIPSVELDGYRFSVREIVGVDSNLYQLFVHLKCPFCQRENECPFTTREDLGQLIVDPHSDCTSCGKPLAASGESAS